MQQIFFLGVYNMDIATNRHEFSRNGAELPGDLWIPVPPAELLARRERTEERRFTGCVL
jgi:hypothetical protein